MSRTSARQWTGQIFVAAAMGASLTGLYMFNGIQEAAKAEMHLTDLDLSLVEGVAVAIPLAMSGIPIGMLADRMNRMRLMLAMTGLWIAAALGTALAPSVPLLFAMRVLAATAGAAMLTTSVSLAADFSPPEHRGQAMLVNNLGKIAFSAAALPVGAALLFYFTQHPFPAVSGIGRLQPWRAAHLALAAGGLLAAMLLLFVREPVRQELGAGTNARMRAVFNELWSRRAYLGPLVFGQVGILMADAAATIWATPILVRKYHMEPLQFAAWLGLAGLFAGIFGSVVGGVAADAGHRSGRKGWIMLGAVISSAVAIPAALFPLMPDVTSFLAALTVLLICGTIASLALMAVIGTYLPNETRGLAFGAFLAFGGLIGFGVAPTLVVFVSGWLGGEAHLTAALALVGVVVSIGAFISFVDAMRKTPLDQSI